MENYAPKVVKSTSALSTAVKESLKEMDAYKALDAEDAAEKKYLEFGAQGGQREKP